MPTKIVNSVDAANYGSTLSEAAAALRDGALVIFPTETVYGIAANAAHAAAMGRLRHVKGRTPDRPFTVHLARRSDARRYLPDPSPLIRRLIRKAWPGPLTLVCDVPRIEETEIAQTCPREQWKEIFYEGTVGLRCPDHPAAEFLLGQADAPIVASSANRTGNPPPFDAQEALRDLEGQADYVIDAGRTRLHAASSVVEVRGNAWKMQRTGALDERTLARLARSEFLFVCTGNTCRSPMAAALFRQKLAQRLGLSPEELAAAGYFISSAGTFGGGGAPASEGGMQEMARRGIDLTGHRSQPLTIELLQRAEKIYAMSPDHREIALALAPGAAGRTELMDKNRAVSDPVGGGPDEYRACADQLERAVEARLEEFLHEDRDW